ncbi:uncharacterized protein F4822DRAFT_425591 [Hypoxylon trugodes]|uniref:uncharacterized protein n=1 Tax=Hypoxylon trugodes TaxID=326681 RepID=UPI002191679F|nr:uncharacterized protein F4822DRAFT_425591 [Hypoxylon trugodes]KAI1392382.1 hypothetical protein F4822DRAFT_425591 [Hypoxylon trugodes]
MSCRMPGCHYIQPGTGGWKSKLDHDKNTNPGTAFYYCSIHSVYHCVVPQPHRRLPQPLCGECAWLFFRFPVEAVRYPESDLVATAGPDDVWCLNTDLPIFGDDHRHPFGHGGDVTSAGILAGHAHPPRTIEEALTLFDDRFRNGNMGMVSQNYSRKRNRRSSTRDSAGTTQRASRRRE